MVQIVGTTEQQISRVPQLGGPSAWIDDQLAQAPSLHLPIVNARFQNGFDGQIGRYYDFWDHALRARDQLSQHAPLTARSVFNFFSPSFSPPGAIREAGLVAPEFQIKSATWINGINSSFMIMIQEDRFYHFFPARLNLDIERALLNSPSALINRLDLLLFSGGMSAELRQLLKRYMAENDDPEMVARERLLRDVISLAFVSADYTVQR